MPPPTTQNASTTPKPPLAIHPTAIIADTVLLHGTHQISIGASAVIHPRARLYSYDGPIVIGEGCVIGEKSTIGSGATIPSSSATPTRLSSSVIIAPFAMVLPGVSIQTAAVIDSLAIVNRNASVGAHAKVCSGCEIPENGVVDDWAVIWGGPFDGQRRRRRPPKSAQRACRDAVDTTSNNNDNKNHGGGDLLDIGTVEDARLIVLQKERESLAKMIGFSSSPVLQKKR